MPNWNSEITSHRRTIPRQSKRKKKRKQRNPNLTRGVIGSTVTRASLSPNQKMLISLLSPGQHGEILWRSEKKNGKRERRVKEIDARRTQEKENNS
ncbi:hypothetical protein GWI33_005605 [Rhynchophorus ferrugineus]|uniref:Uncharacterized protein n=1 Tax=Rhynchophorus ferrugineus TaxID=354439 RepID=A0A834MFV9_RHYFE|nr:hypothetical protein GWI33_005605 [Rhynchophorus ferrugineus]